MEPYGRLRRNAAWAETQRFWNVHQVWKYFAALVAGIIRMIWSGQQSLIDSILTAALWAVIFYVVAWIGTFLINYIWLVPAALHREQWTALEASRNETRSVNSAIETLRAELSADRDKDNRPEITGLAANFRCPGRRSTGDLVVIFDMLVWNIRPARTNLRKIAINASGIKPRMVFFGCNAPDVILEQGIVQKIEVRAVLIMDVAANPHDTVEIDLSALGISAVDGYGNQHSLRIESGTILFLDPDQPLIG
jgi:hypothetical protein